MQVKTRVDSAVMEAIKRNLGEESDYKAVRRCLELKYAEITGKPAENQKPENSFELIAESARQNPQQAYDDVKKMSIIGAHGGENFVNWMIQNAEHAPFGEAETVLAKYLGMEASTRHCTVEEAKKFVNLGVSVERMEEMIQYAKKEQRAFTTSNRPVIYLSVSDHDDSTSQMKILNAKVARAKKTLQKSVP